MKVGASYIAIILAVLLLMDTYPLLASEDLVFRSKGAAMSSSVAMIVSSLSGLDRLSEENVAAAMAVVEESGLDRILISDAMGQVLYDTRETGGAVGDHVLYAELVDALLGDDAWSCYFEDGAFRSRAAQPVVYQDRIIGAVYAYEYDTEQAALLLRLQADLLRLSLGIGIGALLLSLSLTAALARRIGGLLTAIREMREGSYGHRAPVRGRDEIAQIGEALNGLADRLQTTEEARRRFVSDASHELKTPLAAIRLLTDSIMQTDGIDLATTKEFVSDIGAESERLTRITEDLLRLTRLDSGIGEAPTLVDALAVLEQVMRMMELVAQERGVEISYRAEDACTVIGTRDEIYQVFYNLVDNAVKYTSHTVQAELAHEGGQVVFTVEDDGAGIPEADLGRIFERFYRVDKARSRAAGGTGLGLAIVSETVRRRHGTVEAAARPEGGAVFTVRWPAEEGGGPA